MLIRKFGWDIAGLQLTIFYYQLDVEDDPFFVSAFRALYGSLVPGDGLYGATELVALCIIRFAKCTGGEARFGDGVDLEIAEEEVFSVEQENQFIQPCDEQLDCIVAFHCDLATGHSTYLLWRYHQALHALCCMDKQFCQGVSKGV